MATGSVLRAVHVIQTLLFGLSPIFKLGESRTASSQFIILLFSSALLPPILIFSSIHAKKLFRIG